MTEEAVHIDIDEDVVGKQLKQLESRRVKVKEARDKVGAWKLSEARTVLRTALADYAYPDSEWADHPATLEQRLEQQVMCMFEAVWALERGSKDGAYRALTDAL